MKNILIYLFLTILSLWLLALPVKATASINKFGIHILIPDEVFKAAKLVNSTGGDWGWVTIVIRDDQMEKETIQKFFDDCRELHLIPLIRIATHQEKDYWVAPTNDDAAKWADFFSDLNWPTENRYVIIFNEPNHAKEWDGKVNPKSYAEILNTFIDKFKSVNSNFFILNSGFDLAASNTKTTMEVLKFWQIMEQTVPGIFNKLDGWVSHSYPNHGFIGTPNQTGRTSIQGYGWELQTLKKYFQANLNLPVFITETGWPYKITTKEKFHLPNIVAAYIQQAYENVWLPDDKVLAVTPFLLFYDQSPFSNFSWINKDGQTTPQFTKIQSLPKNSWWPKQEIKYEFKKIFLPPFLPTDSTCSGKLILKNTGQSIWGEQKSLNIPGLEMATDKKIKPGDSAEFEFVLYSGTVSGQLSFSWTGLPEFKILVLPSSIITKVEYNLWQKFINLFREFFRKVV